jgi:FtsH-binding integral membrane protein
VKTTTFDFSDSRDMTYVRQVYLWLVVGLLVASGTAWLSLNVGTLTYVTMETGHPDVLAPAIVAWATEHFWISFILSIVLVICATVFRKVRGLSAVFYFVFTGVMGVIAGPALFYAQYKAAQHVTLSANPIRDSFLLTLGAFLGLTAYSWTSKRDFSWMAGMLWTGLWVTLIATCISIFTGSRPFILAVDSVVILLFCGYIVYDTQQILKKSNGDDAIGDALNLFLDVFNIFVRLLSISSSSKD